MMTLSLDRDPVHVSGWGSAPYARQVTFPGGQALRRQVIEQIDRGIPVVLRGCPPAGGNHGSTDRRIIWAGARLVTRTIETTEEETRR